MLLMTKLLSPRHQVTLSHCLLTFGNHVVVYHHICQGAFKEGLPLYHRDVKKLDWQDDNAATQLHSAAWVKFMVTHHTGSLRLFIPLYVVI